MLTSNLAFQMWIMVRMKSDDRQQNLPTFRYAHADVEDVYSAAVEVASLHGNEAAVRARGPQRPHGHPEIRVSRWPSHYPWALAPSFSRCAAASTRAGLRMVSLRNLR